MTTTTASSKKDKASARHTACVCPVCGADAGYDLAVNPGPAVGGEPPDPFPPPEGVTLPEPTVQGAHGPWYLVQCSTLAHRTLVHESELEGLAPPEPPPVEGGAKDAKTTPSHAAPSHPHAEKK